MSTIKEISGNEKMLIVQWESGEVSRYPYLYLRDNCPSETTVHSNGQKLIETSGIHPDICPESCILNAEGEVVIVWNTESHTSCFSARWLFIHRLSKSALTDRHSKKKDGEEIILWDHLLEDHLPAGDFTEISENNEKLKDWLDYVSRYGFAILHNVPSELGMVAKVVNLFGYIRETNYGKWFDVKTKIDPDNLAFTSLGLSAHTDNPYRVPIPTLQLLHCLESSIDGGSSILVDGFKVISDLRSEHPHMFDLLSCIPVTFRFQSADVHFENTDTIIGLNAFGDVNAIRFNNRSIQAFEIGEDLMPAFYSAYMHLAKMLESDVYRIQFKMNPTDLFMVDNERVLHGRTAYDHNYGERFLQGAYADRDGLLSRLRILKQQI